jgi:adenylylsulfate kinase
MRQHSHKVEVLDEAEVYKNLCAELGYSKEDRDTNVRRPGFVCGFLTRNGVDAITAAVSPYRQDQG